MNTCVFRCSCILWIAIRTSAVFAQPASPELISDMSNYASQITAALKSLENQDGPEALAELSLTDPKLRSWEYDYLLNQAEQVGKEADSTKVMLEGSKKSVACVTFSKDGGRLFVGHVQEPVRVWDLAKNEVVELLDSKTDTGCIAISPDGTKLATESPDGEISIWDALTGDRLTKFPGYDLPKLRDRLLVSCIGFSPDSTQIVSVVKTQDMTSTQRSEVKIASIDGKTVCSYVERGPKYLYNAIFSRDGKSIAVGGWDKSLKILDAESGKATLAMQGHENNVLGVSINPEGSHIVTASADGTLAVWDISTGDELLRMNGHSPVLCVQYSPNGKRILSGAWDGSVKIWSAETGVELLSLATLAGPVQTVAFSPDGNRIAAGGGVTGDAKRIFDTTIWNSLPLPNSKPTK